MVFSFSCFRLIRVIFRVTVFTRIIANCCVGLLYTSTRDWIWNSEAEYNDIESMSCYVMFCYYFINWVVSQTLLKIKRFRCVFHMLRSFILIFSTHPLLILLFTHSHPHPHYLQSPRTIFPSISTGNPPPFINMSHILRIGLRSRFVGAEVIAGIGFSGAAESSLESCEG